MSTSDARHELGTPGSASGSRECSKPDWIHRAFQYAGARSVLASLWSVADESTAALMDRFYRHLKAGRSKDVALQRPQMELSRTARTAHPFHWAAFTLSGDWLDGARR